MLDWPGKSKDDGFYPAACHMLDVAAVAEQLVIRAGLSSQVSQAIVLLTALHDLGKFSSSFRDMIEGKRRVGTSHWELSEYHLHSLDETLLASHLQSSLKLRQMLYAATAGHHGRPPSATGDAFQRMSNLIGTEAADAAGAFTALCLNFWPQASLVNTMPGQFKALSWWLAGFVTVADWIGSNNKWFPLEMRGRTLAGHLEDSRYRAEVAVKEAGLSVGKAMGSQLFSFALRPMQQAAETVPLPEGSVLAIIEDETGAGKTEAAMILAQRMLCAGKGAGVYFALPTMATSNAMFKRAVVTVGKLFKGPSLTLAHGRAGLNVDFQDVQGQVVGDDNNVTCAPWLTDSRRRALLAQVGVGTIDQAFLSILPTKHNTLRIWGLSQKILIVDEVHEMGNPYMLEEMKCLLQSHAMQGGSAILLSATLPLRQRQQLVNAFEAGAGRPPVILSGRVYPSLNIVGTEEEQIQCLVSQKGVVHVERLGTEAEAVQLLHDAVKGGAACVWIRNSVDDALTAVKLLKTQGLSPMLLHARFAFADRQRREAEVLAKFGRNRVDRPGLILVATQIVESSLDLDFDVLVSDLAPMAAIIQRAGRLWRHMNERPANKRPVPAPILHVLSPDPNEVENAMWLKNVMGKGSYVYPVADQWRTAKQLFTIGKIDAPKGLRDLIEAVHGEDLPSVPAALERAELEAIGKESAERNLGQQNVIDFALQDYRTGGGANDDVNYPTRTGPPQRTLLLVKREKGELSYWQGHGAEGEMLSEVSASRVRLEKCGLPIAGEEAAEIQSFKNDWPEWKKCLVTVVEVRAEGKITEKVFYSESTGLYFET